MTSTRPLAERWAEMTGAEVVELSYPLPEPEPETWLGRDRVGNLLPQYQSHKRVWALKIRQVVEADDDHLALLFPEDLDVVGVYVDKAYMDKHQPRPGGYWVRYPDGYESWSPAEAFESGYTRISKETT